MPSDPMESTLKERSYDSEPAKYLEAADYAWIIVFAFVVLVNLWFGLHNHAGEQKVAETKANAARLLAWFEDNGKIRELGQSVISGCDDPSDSWRECLASLVASGGPFETLTNQLEPTGKVFSDVCVRGELATLGTIVIERGAPKPQDPTAMVYARMPAAQDLSSRLPLKIYVCARSFHPMNVGETVF